MDRLVDGWMDLTEKAYPPDSLTLTDRGARERLQTLFSARREEVLLFLDGLVRDSARMGDLRQRYPHADFTVTDLIGTIVQANPRHVPTLQWALVALTDHQPPGEQARFHNDGLKGSIAERFLPNALSEAVWQKRQGLRHSEFFVDLKFQSVLMKTDDLPGRIVYDTSIRRVQYYPGGLLKRREDGAQPENAITHGNIIRGVKGFAQDDYVEVRFEDGIVFIAPPINWSLARVLPVEKAVLEIQHNDQISTLTYTPPGQPAVTLSRTDGQLDPLNLLRVVKEVAGGSSIIHLKIDKDAATLFAPPAASEANLDYFTSSPATAGLEEGLTVLWGHTNTPTGIAFGPKHLFSVSVDGTARVWDPATGQSLPQLDTHWTGASSASFDSVAASHGGRALVAAGRVGEIVLYDANSGRELGWIAIPGFRPERLVFDPTGQKLIAMGIDQEVGRLRVWDVGPLLAPQEIQGEIQDFPIPGSKGWMDTAVSRDGTTAAVISREGALHLIREVGVSGWTQLNKTPISVRLQNLTAVEFDAEGRRLFLGSGDGVVVMKDLASGAEKGIAPNNAGDGFGRVHDFALSPDGKRLAVAGGKEVSLVDLSTARTVALAPYLEGWFDVNRLAFSPDGRQLAYTGTHRERGYPVAVWDLPKAGLEEQLSTESLTEIAQGRAPTQQEVQGLTAWLMADLVQTAILSVPPGDTLEDGVRDRIGAMQKAWPAFSAWWREYFKESPTPPSIPVDSLWRVYVPLSQWIIQQKRQVRPDGVYVFGVSGSQGVGKTVLVGALASILNALLAPEEGQAVARSIDDYYKSKRDRKALKPLGYDPGPEVSNRGPPGTHTTDWIWRNIQEFDKSTPGSKTVLGNFNKAIDDQAAEPLVVHGKVGIFLLEGWFLGADTHYDLAKVAPGFKRVVAEANQRDYRKVSDRLDGLLAFRKPPIEEIRKNREEQEQQRKRGMSPEAIARFVDYFYVDSWDWANTSPVPRMEDTTFLVGTDANRHFVSIERGGRPDDTRKLSDTRFLTSLLKKEFQAASRLHRDIPGLSSVDQYAWRINRYFVGRIDRRGEETENVTAQTSGGGRL